MKNIYIKSILTGTVLLLVAICLSTTTAKAAATTRYVKPAAIGNGTSWADASGDLQAMINVSTAGDEIWVAAGTYKPTHSAANWTTAEPTSENTNHNDRNNAFVLKTGVKIYGGFAGGETDISQRPPVETGRALSLLSGDLKGDDQPDFVNKSDNAYHVVVSADAVGDALLDGFTITGGNADGSGDISVNFKSINLGFGGGMYNCSSSPTLTNVTISGNSTSYNGGGMYNYGSSSPTLTNVIISGNSANYGGGGMYNEMTSSPALTNVTISGNSASYEGGGMYNRFDCSPALTNVTISGNNASYEGGGMYNYGSSSPALINSIIWGNRAGSSSNVSNNSYSNPTYNYSLLEDVNLTMGIGNLNGTLASSNPLFVNPTTISIPTSTGDYRLQQGSPCIDAGNDGDNNTATDLAGSQRKIGDAIDIGAYERKHTALRATAVMPNTEYGTSLAPTLTDGTNPGGADTLYMYAVSENGTYAPTPVPRNIGTYWLKGVLAETSVSYTDTTIAVSFKITPKSITINGVTASNKVYDGNTTATIIGNATASLSDNYDVGNLTIDTTSATATFDNKNVGKDKTVAFSGYTLSGSAADNYSLTAQPARVSANITEATLTITPSAGQSKVYGDPNPSAYIYTVRGWQGSDDSTSLPLDTLARVAGEDVDTYTFIYNNSLSVGSNYTFDVAAETFAITPAMLTATAVGTTRLYGDDNPVFRITYEGWKNGDGIDALSVAPRASTTATTSSAVNTYPITTANGAANNYAFNYIDGTLTVKKATLTVTPNAGQVKLHGTADPATYTYTTSNWEGSDATLNLLTGALTRTIGEDGGTYAITQGDLLETSGNYMLNFTTGVTFAITLSSNTKISSVTVSDATLQTGSVNFYLPDCAKNVEKISLVQITVTPEESTSQVIYKGTAGSSFSVDISRADIHDITYTVRSTDGSEQKYTLQIESRFAFNDIVGMMFNNVLYVNNNPANNGDYKFSHYEWYRNGQPIGFDQQHYSAGPTRTNLLDRDADYSVTVTTIDGKVLHVCPGKVSSESVFSLLRAYPNPASQGAKIRLESPAADGTPVRIYNMSGELVGSRQTLNGTMQFTAPQAAGVYLLTVDGETVKVLVE
ncbi:hypothetical protein FACS1894199_10830 [Bacteroidia bacterium]|nr:hypothetical protein FACS1894199_10830 [Bacteroidia bacterium]